MTCFDTLYAWRSDKPSESGKRPLEFRSNGRSIMDESALLVPCGRCIGCLSDKARIWSIRMYHEWLMHKQSCFLTLTYADDQKFLDKEHLVKFFKRLRHHYGSFRYFACGEYGSKTGRPHYHVILYGHDFLGGSYPITEELYGNKIVEMIWQSGLDRGDVKRGFISIGSVTMESIKYVAGYVVKQGNPVKLPEGAQDEFLQMSRKPGIGKGWLEKYKEQIINNGFVVIDGCKLDIPKQYMAWYEHEFEEVKEKRKEKVKFFTDEQLRSKKINLRSKLGLKTEVF